MEKGYRNLGFWMMLLIPFTFFGFYKTYFMHLSQFEVKNGVIIHLHALFSSLWIILMIIQPFLIQAKKMALHKTIGKLSYPLFVLLILSMIPTIANSYEKGGGLFMPLFNFVLILLFFILAIINRKITGRHMRYMIGIALVFVTPSMGRVTLFYFGFDRLMMIHTLWTAINLLLLMLLLGDVRAKRDPVPYGVILIGFIFYQLGLYYF